MYVFLDLAINDCLICIFKNCEVYFTLKGRQEGISIRANLNLSSLYRMTLYGKMYTLTLETKSNVMLSVGLNMEGLISATIFLS